MFKEFLNVIPKVTMLPDYDIKPEADWYGVKAIKYEGAEYKGKKTEIFSYIGYPENAKTEKVPAMVLVHGGGGHAYAHWVKIWNDRGYAAIAMDLRGAMPIETEKGLIGTEMQRDDKFQPMPTYDDYIPMPDGYCVYDESQKITDWWFYQSIANIILAHNILLNDPKVDSSKIGITGISWGGILSSQVIAHDKRFAFAIPIYGSGYLNLSLSGVCRPFTKLPAARIWNMGSKYNDITFPILWLCMDSDVAFDILPNSISYLQTKKSGSVLAIRPGADHSHVDGWNMEESYRFAQEVVDGNITMVTPVSEPEGFGEVSFQITSSNNVTATLYYLTETMRYTEDSKPDYTWQTLPCTITGNTVSVTIPADAENYYISLTQEKDGIVYTTATSYIHSRT